MPYECVVRRLTPDEIAVTSRACETSPLQTDMVQLKVTRAVVDLHHLHRALALGPTEADWQPLDQCGLAGRVLQVGDEVERLQVGDRVSALGPLVSQAVLPVQECLPVPKDVNEDQAAHWALLVALVRSVKELHIEIGESVLVLGGGLIGHLIAQLCLMAGAARVVGLDLKQESDHRAVGGNGSGPAPTWVADPEALQQALSDRKVDVLIDLLSDEEQLNRMLSLVQDGGRAILLGTNDAIPVDFDCYPNIHRRSLQLRGDTLQAALRRKSPGGNHSVKETAFINHLLKSDRLDPMCWRGTYMRLSSLTEQVLPATERLSLIVEWDDYDEKD